MAKRSGLGKGLNALIPSGLEKQERTYVDIDVDQIDPNPDQPRHVFDDASLRELAESIRHNGVIQPIIVTRHGSRYQLVAGERRWRAAQIAGFDQIPGIIREVEAGQRLTLALLENIQRQELNPIEEALAYSNLLETKDFTQDALAKNLGKSRASISNTIRLLRLPDRVRNLIEDGALSFGHAKCLITLSDDGLAEDLANRVVSGGWSVRELERRIQQQKEKRPVATPPQRDVFIKRAELVLSRCIGTTVAIKGNEKQGKVMIPYKTQDELQRIYEWLTQQQEVEE